MKDMIRLQKAYDGAVQNDTLNRLGLGSLFVVQNINNNSLTINMESGTSDFALVRGKLLDHALSLGLRKRDGMVYSPVPGCPCAYTQMCNFKDYINLVLHDEPLFSEVPKRFDECVSILTNQNKMTKMPELVCDRDLLSFSNGVLQLATATFNIYSDMDPECELARRVARHHIPFPYMGSAETPYLDQILDAQFDKDVAEVLCALIGRALFTVGQLDGWQVMLFMSGVGGTGKSLVLNIIASLFAPEAVGNLAAKREEIFGMANLVDREIVLGSDMPAKMSASLPQEIMQTMTAGDRMEIPRKGQVALQVKWTAPVILAGNHYPDYVNTGNNVGRRMVTVRFDNVITTPQDNLLECILQSELPNIVYRCLHAYMVLRVWVGELGGFWKAMPSIMLEWKSKLSASTNKLAEFLALDEDDRGCSITCVQGKTTWLMDFKAVFEARMKVTYVADPAVFATAGFRVSDKLVNVCPACKQSSAVGSGRCCPSYDHQKRAKKHLVYDMVMEENAS